VTLEASVRLTNPSGLHARPAVKLARLAASFKAKVELRAGEDGRWVRARSTANLMRLKVRADTTLYLRAQGEDAPAAVQALLALVRRDFDEHGDAETGAATAARASDLAAPDRRATHPTHAPDRSGVFDASRAAPGIAVGWLGRARSAALPDRPPGPPQAEREHLLASLAAARDSLSAMAADAGELVSGVLGFQQALLDDEAFIAPILQAVQGGTPSEQAWNDALATEIERYESGEDQTFRGRAADLRDLRDRVAGKLRGANGAVLDRDAPAADVILLVDELTPSRFLETDWQRVTGVASCTGSPSDHVAMLARARGVPLVVGLKATLEKLPDGVRAVLDADHGRLLVDPAPELVADYVAQRAARDAEQARARRYLEGPATTLDGVVVTVSLNVDGPGDLDGVAATHCDGIGLTRTEFLFRGATALPDEEHQYRAYRRLLEWAGGRSVTVRTLDAGGDKPIPGLTPEGEGNPFLGLRGLRLSLANPEVFRVQLRALVRAASHGPLRIMVPMVTRPEELAAARGLLEEEVGALLSAGVKAVMPRLGMMVEVPAAAIGIAAFNADFYSIGSNDLIQYVSAAGRDCAAVAELLDPLQPTVLELIARVAAHGRRQGVEVSVCGEMAAMPECLEALLGAGVRALSVPAGALARIKAALAECRIPEG